VKHAYLLESIAPKGRASAVEGAFSREGMAAEPLRMIAGGNLAVIRLRKPN